MEAAHFFVLVAILCFIFAAQVISTSGEKLPYWDVYDSYTDWQHVHVDQTGQYVDMTLDQLSAAAFGSQGSYFTGRLSIKLKLSCNNTAGTVMAFYASSPPPYQDECDMEFLGNISGQPYVLQTNVFVNGTGNREMRHTLWFNPCEDYHEYTIFWNSKMILFYVDSTPIRVFMNYENIGIPYLTKPMFMHATLWDASSWATNGGATPLDWSCAPFKAYGKDFDSLNGCKVWNDNVDACKYPATPWWWEGPDFQALNQNQINLLKWVQQGYLGYDYCADLARFPDGVPQECYHIPY